jgi:hypothetical protein
MRKLGLLIIVGVWLLYSPCFGMKFQLSAGLASDRPISKPLPGLGSGFGYTFSLGFLPVEKAGLSIGVCATNHSFDAGVYNGKTVSGDSHRSTLFAQIHYQFLKLNTTEFEAYLGGSYNSINGGDSSGGYLNIEDINKDDIGYSGYGGIFGAGVMHPIKSGYFLNLAIRFVLLNYSKYQLPNYSHSDVVHNRKGNSVLINLAIVYRVDFSQF